MSSVCVRDGEGREGQKEGRGRSEWEEEGEREGQEERGGTKV